MKTIYYKILFVVCFFSQTIHAQDPNWSLNSADFQYSMTFTTFLNVNGTTLTTPNDKVAAFVNGEIRGVANVQFVASANKYVAYLTVYSNTAQETIDFKIYNSTTTAVANVNKQETFVIDGNLGGIFQSYSIAEPQLNENATFTSFNFLGITEIVSNISSDKVTIVLPKNTDLSSLVAVFDTNENANVFVDEVLQSSGSTAHNFTNTIIYKVLSENEATITTYQVAISTALNNNPITVVISSLENLNTNSAPVSLDVTFSEVVSGFDASDFRLENAATSSFSTIDFQTYKVKIVPLSQGAFSVQIPENVSLDINKNQNETSNKLELTYDISKPIISTVSVKENSVSLSFMVAFSEAVLNVDVSDFELKGVASDGLSISNLFAISPNEYQVDFSSSNIKVGIISLQLKSTNNIKDVAGNELVKSEFEAYFLKNETLSTENFLILNNISIFPNPTNDFLNIHLPSKNLEKIVLYNINGEKVFEQICKQKEEVINVQKLNSGIYFIKIIFKRTIVTKKFVKT